jgi:hypothetical protein
MYDSIATRIVRLTQSSGFIEWNIEPDVYDVTLECYAFRLFDAPSIHQFHIDGLDCGSYTFPVLVNHSGYSTINAHYLSTFLQPRMSYRITDLNGALVDFTTTGQDLVLVFQLIKHV